MTTSYHISTARGPFQLDLPDGYTITFGPAIPFTPGARQAGALEYAVRVYDSSKRLRACFPGVYAVWEKGLRPVPLARGVEEIPMPGDDDDQVARAGRIGGTLSRTHGGLAGGGWTGEF